MGSKAEEVDNVLQALGGNSKYQHIQNLLITFSALSACFQLLDMIYIGQLVPHQCAPPPNGTDIIVKGVVIPHITHIEYKQCSIDIQYNTSGGVVSHSLSCLYGMQYSQRKDISVVSEFDLVCEREALGDLPQTLLILGQALGALTLPYFSDRYGRKPIHIVSHITVMAIGIGIAFSPNYLVFAILRLLVGAAQQGIVLTTATYTIELFPAEHRRIVGFIGCCVWTAAALLMTPIGYFFRFESWRTLQLIFSSVSIYFIVQIIYLDESFRWLVANGRYDTALKIVRKATAMNNAGPELVMEKFNLLAGVGEVEKRKKNGGGGGEELFIRKDEETPPSPAIKKYTMLDVLRIKRLALNIGIFWYLWCCGALCYFGLFFTSTSLSGDPYLNIFLNISMEAPSCIIFWFIIDRYGRKFTAVVFFGMGGLCLIAATIINTTTDDEVGSVFVTIFTLIGKVGASGGFGLMFFYTPEIFPTNLRNIGIGSCSIAARVGGMLAPFSRMMSQHIPWGPGAIFGICSVIATLLVKLLPETKGKQLPQTLSDMKLLHQKKSGDNDDARYSL